MKSRFQKTPSILGYIVFSLPSVCLCAFLGCPCGYLGDPTHTCVCTASAIARYRHRISGPLLDRIDLHIEVPAVPYREMRAGGGESSAIVRQRVEAVRERSAQRLREVGIAINAEMTSPQTWRFAEPDPDGHRLLETLHDRLGLSARGLIRVLKVARTIADLDGADNVRAGHIAEAVQYRTLDRHAP